MNKFISFLRESTAARFFIPLGLILIIFAVAMFVINTRNQNYIKIEATVSNVELYQESYTDIDGNHVEATYTVKVKYNVDGKEYEATLDDVFKYNIGDKITIYYNPNNPNEITQTKSLIVPIVLISGGIASLAGGIISAVNAVKRHKKMKEQERSFKSGE